MTLLSPRKLLHVSRWVSAVLQTNPGRRVHTAEAEVLSHFNSRAPEAASQNQQKLTHCDWASCTGTQLDIYKPMHLR